MPCWLICKRCHETVNAINTMKHHARQSDLFPNETIALAKSEKPRPSILTRATGFMGEYDFTLNPYGGCTFGCTYCYAAFFSHDKKLQENWGKWVRVKDNNESPYNLYRQAGKWMQSENNTSPPYKLSPKSLDGKTIYMSSVTDPYQPIERKLRLTRHWLEQLAENQKPKLVVQTRSPDVTRDCDLFQQIKNNGGKVQINMTITTDDEDVRRAFEPSCPSNAIRIKAIKEVQENGITACITMTPLLIVSDPQTFANRLLDTGVRKFIVQPFHFNKGKFIAQTREQAIDAMAEKLGCEKSQYKERYLEHYNKVTETLKETLPQLGEGKDGFAPPF